MNVIINIYFLYIMCDRVADKLFSSSARIVSSGGYYGGTFTGEDVNPMSKYLGESYKEILRLTNYYVSFYSKASPEFYSWYMSNSHELDEAKRRIMLNPLNDDVKSMKDLEGFWQSTMGPLLEGNLIKLKNMLLKLEETIRSYDAEANVSAGDTLKNSSNEEGLMKRYYKEATIIYGLLESGCTNYRQNKYGEVHEWFLMAAGSRKKFNLMYSNLFPGAN